MKKKSLKTKLGEVFKKRDNHFWLMIFVVSSTLFIIIIWSLNLNNLFPSRTFKDDLDSMGLSNLKSDIKNEQEAFSRFKELMDKMKEEDDAINQEEIEKLKKAIGERVATSSSSENNNDEEDLIPVISSDLDDSEQRIKELEEKFKELEERLNSN